MKNIALGIIASCCMVAPLCAQLHVETGGGESRLDLMPSSSMTAFGGGLNALLGRTHFQFSGGAENHIGLGVAGTMSGSLHYRFTPGGWQIEVGPTSNMAREIGEQWVTTVAGDVHAERVWGHFTMQGGWQQGVAQSGSHQTLWHRPNLGAEFRFGSLQLGALWQSTELRDSALRSNIFFDPSQTHSDSLSQARIRDIKDIGVRMAWSGGPLSLAARAGQRTGATIAAQTWWEGYAAVKISPIMALTMRTGRMASDALLGLRGGQYTTLGVRMDLLQHTSAGGRNAPRSTTLTQVIRESTGAVRLCFTLPPGTREAVLAGDMTDWHPINLSLADDGRWEVVLSAKAGVHRINIRTNSGPWIVPPGLPETADGFGATVGLLVVEQ